MINIIIDAFDKNWTLERMNGRPVMPVIGRDNIRNPVSPKVKVKYYHGKHNGKNLVHTETFVKKLPRVLIVTMFDLYGIPQDEGMLVLNIEQDLVYSKHIQAGKKILDMANAARSERNKYQDAMDMPSDKLSLYRTWLKWNLCINYINLQKEEGFFREQNLIKW